MDSSNIFSLDNFNTLYDLLFNQTMELENYNIQLTDDEIKSLLEKISKMDEYGSGMIYVWIRIYSLRNSNSKLMDIPYEGDVIDKKVLENNELSTIKFDVRNFPPILNRMIDRFVTLHLNRMNSEKLKVRT